MTWPNLLSALRIAMVPLFIMALIERRPVWAITIFVVAGLTDLLDGYVARFYKLQSALGSLLDPTADKLLITSAFILLCWPGVHSGLQIPIWVTVLVIGRDLVIVVGALFMHLTAGLTQFQPSRISKLNTTLQLSAVSAYLLTGLSRDFDPLARGLLALMVLATAVSGLEYAYRFIFRAEDLVGQKPDGDSA